MPPKAKAAPAVEYDGPMSGECSFYYANGCTYTGAWKMVLPPDDALPPPDGVLKPTRVRHGKGVFQADGYKFVGEFCDDAMNGKGTFTFASGAFYNGDFKRNKFDGSGVYQWPTGDSYDGEFVENCMHGKGTYKDACGRLWSGTFFQGSGPGLTYNLE